MQKQNQMRHKEETSRLWQDVVYEAMAMELCKRRLFQKKKTAR
jgi:hypothetical protein